MSKTRAKKPADASANEDATPEPDTDSPSAPASAAEAEAPSPAELSPAAAKPDPEELGRRLEAVLMASEVALPSAKLQELLSPGGVKVINDAIAALNTLYEQTGRSFRIEKVAGGWQVHTLPAYADVLAAAYRSRQSAKLSTAALETLAIIAYKQPVLRAEVEAIRGVACGEVLRSLMERRLIKIVGRSEEIGRPMLYGTTRGFLEIFGLADLKDLPKVEELKNFKQSSAS